MGVRVSLLGARSIVDEVTGAARTRSQRTIALTAFLAVHAGSAHGRQQIAGQFWPDSTDAQALTNLRRELHGVRRVLGAEPCIVATSRDLAWRDVADVQVDVRTFAVQRELAFAAARDGDDRAALGHADAALAEYKGEFLPGDYDDWLSDVRDDLRRQCVDLCELICTTRRTLGEPAAALDAARRRIQLEPLEEPGYAALMRLQADLGDRAGAMSTYHRCAAVLERELSVSPAAAIQALLQQVMTQDPGPVGPPPAAAAVLPEESIDESRLAPVRLVGRRDEHDQLRRLWSESASGRSRLALVRGAAGVGKTRLLAEMTADARGDDAVVAVSRCFGTSGRLALAPVADWLRTPAVRAATRSLDPVWRREVERLVPAETAATRSRSGPRAPAIGAGTSARAMVDAWQQHRFFEGLARALLAVGRPMLLVLDNLHWCDPQTLAFVTFFLGLSRERPVLLAAALRSPGPDDDRERTAWIARMRATGVLTELPLAPLEADRTAELAAVIAGRRLPPAEQELLQAATGGFPLHIIEAMWSMNGQDPGHLPAEDLAAVLDSRLGRTTPAAGELAQLAAAVGRDFTLDLLVEASELDADVVVRAVDELWRSRILVEHGDGYDFGHDLLREAAYARISPPVRWLLHRRLAQSLERLHTTDTFPVSAQLAEQYARGGRPEQAVTHYRRAAEMASRIFAHDEAVRVLSAALSLVRDQPAGHARDLLELVLLEEIAAPINARDGFSSPQLQEVLECSVELSGRLGHRGSTAAALVNLWTGLFVQGRIEDAYRAASRGLELVTPGSPLSGAAHFAVAGSLVILGRPAESLPHFGLAADLSHEFSLSVGTRPDVHGPAFCAHAHWLLGDDPAAAAAVRDAVSRAREIDHPYNLAVALAYQATTCQLLGDVAATRSVVAELRALCDRHDFAYYREWVLVLDGWCTGGQVGVELARRGIANLRADGAFARMPYWLSILADLLARAGAGGAACSTLDAAIVGARARKELWWLPELMRLRAGHDEPEHAVERVRATAVLAEELGIAVSLRRCRQDLLRLGHER